MQGCAVNTNTPNLIDASGAVLKTNKEKGSALLQRFVQQSSQNNLDESKTVLKGLNRAPTEVGSNDDLITELEFTETLSGLSKDTAPGPDKVKYSDIKNLSVDNKKRALQTKKACDRTGSRGLVTWLPQASPQTGKGPLQAERIPYPHTAEHNGKADGTDCGQEACSGLRTMKRTSPKPRRIQSRKNTWHRTVVE